jgi:hypothetical protein
MNVIVNISSIGFAEKVRSEDYFGGADLGLAPANAKDIACISIDDRKFV